MIVKLLTEHYLEFLSFKGGCRGSSEPTHVKMPHCWKSHVAAQLFNLISAYDINPLCPNGFFFRLMQFRMGHCIYCGVTQYLN